MKEIEKNVLSIRLLFKGQIKTNFIEKIRKNNYLLTTYITFTDKVETKPFYQNDIHLKTHQSQTVNRDVSTQGK